MQGTEREMRTGSASWDVARIREDFPSLAHGNATSLQIYLDGPAGSQLPACVLQVLDGPGAIDALPGAQAAFADWLGGLAEEIVVGSSMTSLAWQAAQALAPQWNAGDNIVLTLQDHRSNTEAWSLAADARGVEVRWVGLDPDGSLDLDELTAKVTRRTRLLAFSAASNVTGTINDVPRIATIAKAEGRALVFVDAVHLAAHRLGDARRWNCDFLACSAYKFYGPKVAALWIRAGVRDLLAEAQFQMSSQTGSLESLSPAMLAGVQAAIDYVAGKADGSSRRQRLERSASAIASHEQRLVVRLWNGLARLPRVNVLGLPPSGDRTATVGFSLEGLGAQYVCELLARQRIRVGSGHFNAAPLVKALGHGATGVVRAGCMMYTTPDEIDLLLDAVADVDKRRG